MVAPAPSSPCTRVTLPPLNLSEGPRERRPCSLTEELVSAGRLAWRPRARPPELAPVVSHGSSSWLVPGGGGVAVRDIYNEVVMGCDQSGRGCRRPAASALRVVLCWPAGGGCAEMGGGSEGDSHLCRAATQSIQKKTTRNQQFLPIGGCAISLCLVASVDFVS